MLNGRGGSTHLCLVPDFKSFTIKYDVSRCPITDWGSSFHSELASVKQQSANHSKRPSADLCRCLSFLDLHLQPLPTLKSLNLHLYFPISGNLLGPTWVPSLCATVRKLSQDYKLRQMWGSPFFCFPSLSDHYPSMSGVQHLETHCFRYSASSLISSGRRLNLLS